MATPTKLSWDQYFLRMAFTAAQRSECLDKQVGCVIVDKYRRIIGTGYNGFPAGAKNPCEHVCIKEQGKPCGMVHAELNAMLYTDMSKAETIYLTLPPCQDCLKHIRNTPVTTVVMPMSFKGTPKAKEIGALAYFVDLGLPQSVGPGGITYLVAPWIPKLPKSGQFILDRFCKPAKIKSLELVEVFHKIRQYHGALGYPGEVKSEAERYQKFRDLMLAMNQEVAELCDSFPWKPWRPIEDQTHDENNAIMEMVDIIFFMGSILELFGIPPERLEETLHSKIVENYNRIQKGYNKPKEDM